MECRKNPVRHHLRRQVLRSVMDNPAPHTRFLTVPAVAVRAISNGLRPVTALTGLIVQLWTNLLQICPCTLPETSTGSPATSNNRATVRATLGQGSIDFPDHRRSGVGVARLPGTKIVAAVIGRSGQDTRCSKLNNQCFPIADAVLQGERKAIVNQVPATPDSPITRKSSDSAGTEKPATVSR